MTHWEGRWEEVREGKEEGRMAEEQLTVSLRCKSASVPVPISSAGHCTPVSSKMSRPSRAPPPHSPPECSPPSPPPHSPTDTCSGPLEREERGRREGERGRREGENDRGRERGRREEGERERMTEGGREVWRYGGMEVWSEVRGGCRNSIQCPPERRFL